MRNKKMTIPVFIFILAALIFWTAWANTALEINEYTVCSKRLPDSFSGFRIAQVSDLHNTEFGEENEKLIFMLRKSNPDIIVITGDLVDSRRTETDTALKFAEDAVNIAPCYYVPGNHEARLSEYDTLKNGLEQAGVTVLENDFVRLDRSGEFITLAGVSDPAFQNGYDTEIMRGALEEISDGNTYTVLLSHRPELFSVYEEHGIDLALCGHAHGGQFRLPVVGGLIAPHQGLFPKYDAGLFTKENTSMLVSRGIGNSLFPFRLNNHPEIVVAELKHEY
ncbi:MAG: metallophosphoesterase [Anaerovoracaceae bacterium]